MAVGGGAANRGRGGGEAYGKAVRGCFYNSEKKHVFMFFLIRKLMFLTSMNTIVVVDRSVVRTAFRVLVVCYCRQRSCC